MKEKDIKKVVQLNNDLEKLKEAKESITTDTRIKLLYVYENLENSYRGHQDIGSIRYCPYMSSFLAKANAIVIKQIEEKIKELQEELDNI